MKKYRTVHFRMSPFYETACRLSTPISGTNVVEYVTCFNCLAVLESSKGKPLPLRPIAKESVPTVPEMLEVCKKHIEQIETALSTIKSVLNNQSNE